MYNRAMVNHLSDTHPEIAAMQTQLLHQLSPAQRLALVERLNQTARMLALSGLKSRYPNDSPEKLKRRLADLILGADLANKVYGPLDIDD
jgi:hypothetical protein